VSDAGARPPTRIRRRLSLWMLIAVGVAVLLLGLPLALVVRQSILAQAVAQSRSEARQVAVLLEQVPPTQHAEAVQFSARALGARVTVLDTDGRVLHDSGGVAAGTVFDDPAVRAAQGRPSGSHLDGRLVVAVREQIDAVGGAVPLIVRIAEPAGPVLARVRAGLLAIGALAVSSLAVGAALASWRARQLARPLEALARSAARLGEGDFGQRAPRSDVVEIDDIAVALDSTADRLREALRRSASFSADASHQLRTPLTALRLNLDALAIELDRPSPSLDAAEREIDRLEATIHELLTLADAGTQPGRVDLQALTLARLDAWRTIAEAAGRAVRVTREPVPAVRARPGAVGQALQVLLDNALEHGRGDVTVWLEAIRRGTRSWVRLCVGDEGPGVRPDHLTGGTGRGLPLARSLVEADGGRLVAESAHGGRVCLLLPAVEDDPADGALTAAEQEYQTAPQTGS
jgi:signal transduction histidine kinase